MCIYSHLILIVDFESEHAMVISSLAGSIPPRNPYKALCVVNMDDWIYTYRELYVLISPGRGGPKLWETSWATRYQRI